MRREVLLSIKDASFGYGKRTVLSSVWLKVRRGDFLGIVGPNGAGKTTLLKAMLGIIKPKEGSIERANLRFGYVQQRQKLDETYPLNLLNIIIMGRYPRLGLIRRAKEEDRKMVKKCAEQVGVSDVLNSLYRELSGGQKQKALIARALVSEPEVLILDEPTTDMDISSERSIMELISKLHSDGLTIVMVSHHLRTVINYVKMVAFVRDGGVSVMSIEEAANGDVLSRLYSCTVRVERINGRFVIVTEDAEV